MSQNILGQILLNQFRVDAFVALGGMGAVYRLWDLKRNVPLAMKGLHSELAEDPPPDASAPSLGSLVSPGHGKHRRHYG